MALVAVPVAVAIAAVILGWWDSGYRSVCAAARSTALRPLLYGLALPALATPLEPLFFHCPAPSLLWIGAGLGALGSAWRLRLLRPPADDAPDRGWTIAAAVLVVGSLLVPAWTAAQGDEPHYLLVAHSLWEDGDLDLADDYGARVYEPYHPGPLSPHYKPGRRAGSRYSMHGVGYPLFLVPAYALGNLVGPTAVLPVARWIQVLLYAGFALVLYRLLERLGGRRVALAGTVATVALAPLLFAPLHLFPETPAMTALAGAVLLIVAGGTAARLALAGLLLAVLPWLGVKYIPIALTTAVLAPWAAGRGGLVRTVAIISLPIAASLLLHGLFTQSLYGSWSPSAVYLGSDPTFGRQPGYGGSWAAYLADWPNAVRTLIGYFLDQKEGLLAVGPHYLLVAAGLPALVRRHRRLALLLLCVVAAHLLPYALSQQAGGQSPPARPLMAVTWALALPLGYALVGHAGRLVAVARGVLVTLAVALALVLLRDPSLLPHDYGVKASWLLRSLSPQGTELWQWFPVWLGVQGANRFVAWAWALGALGVAVALARSAAAPGPVRASQHRSTPALPAWGGAAYAVLTLGVVGLFEARVVLSDREIGAEIAPGITAWVPESIPARAWAEPGGVWLAPGTPVSVTLTSAAAIGPQGVRLRTLVPATVRSQLEGTTRVESVEPTVPLVFDWNPGPGAGRGPWRAYRFRGQASVGATPAAVEGGDDRRLLGVHLRLEPRPER